MVCSAFHLCIRRRLAYFPIHWLLVLIRGVNAVALEYVPSVEPPENMRSSEWDGEQV